VLVIAGRVGRVVALRVDHPRQGGGGQVVVVNVASSSSVKP